MTAGRLLYLGYHAPLEIVRRSVREGGPFQQWIDFRHRAAMRAAAAKLPPVASLATTPDHRPDLCFLTGRRFWFQTAFCAWSLVRAAGRPLPFVFYDDGTIDDALVAEARRIFPGCQIVRERELASTLDTHLPPARFPALRLHRRAYLHLRKLTDTHAGRRGPRLVLDSDMLFFRRPDAFLAWLENPTDAIHLLDVQDAYGYPAATLQNLANHALPPHVNVGLLGLRSESIDWEKLERDCATLLSTHGTSYYLEQALSALLLAGRPTIRLPAADYRVLPTESECRQPTAALHHYVAASKRGYFRHAWRHLSPTT